MQRIFGTRGREGAKKKWWRESAFAQSRKRRPLPAIITKPFAPSRETKRIEFTLRGVACDLHYPTLSNKAFTSLLASSKSREKAAPALNSLGGIPITVTRNSVGKRKAMVRAEKAEVAKGVGRAAAAAGGHPVSFALASMAFFA
ncbi:MAG: hypothetical protein RL367_1122 [Pseudomonadota bacterium]